MSANQQFEIMEQLGKGGMGVVYKALDKALNRTVALKVLPSHLSENETLVKRFQREARAAAGLNHSNIVTVYSIGEQDGHWHIAMEYVEGKNLAEVLRDTGKQSIQDSVEWIRQSADALAVAHEKSIIHRDIKPHNIMLTPSRSVKVADFGLARVIQDDTELTNDGARLGTPRYMSPEQIEGKALTSRTDIYSLGVVFFELLVGVPAFQADTTVALMRSIVDSPFPNVLESRKDTPPILAKVIAKMTDKDPQKRYRNAAELADDLKAFQSSGTAPGAVDVALDSSGNRPASGILGRGSDSSGAGLRAPTQRVVSHDYGKDFIIHYVEGDLAWAEWIQLQLQEAGYKTEMWTWDFKASHESLRKMTRANEQTVCCIAVCTPAYMQAMYNDPEWLNTLQMGTLEMLPVVVRKCIMGAVFRTVHYINLAELSEEKGKQALIEEARERRGAGGGESQAGLDDILDELSPTKLQHTVWNVPYPSHPQFSGRGEMLSRVYKSLKAHRIATLAHVRPKQGGFGATQAAVEYANLNKNEYSVVWFLRADQRAVLANDFTALAGELGLKEKDARKQGIAMKAVKTWLASNEGWLLIFDGARKLSDVQALLPENWSGHVLVTTPDPAWPKEGQPLPVRNLERQESVEFLFKRTKQRDDGAAAALAASLNDTPLVLNLAGAYIESAKISIDQYIDRFLDRHKAFWGFKDPPKSSPALTASALSLSVERINAESRGAVDLLLACSYFAPTDIRVANLISSAKLFPRSLAKTLSNTQKLNEALTVLQRYGVVLNVNDTLYMHPLVQELMCEWVEADPRAEGNEDKADFLNQIQQVRFGRYDRTQWAASALRYMKDVYPEDSWENEKWVACNRSMYHAITITKHADRLSLNPEMAAEIWRRVASYLFQRSEYARSAGAYDWAIALHQKAHGQKHKGTSRLYKELAHVHRAQSSLQKARADYETALAIDLQVYGKVHEEVAGVYSNLGNVLFQMHDFAGARQYYMKALELDKKVHGDKHADVGRDLASLGLVSQELGDLNTAWEHYRDALEICEAVYGNEHARVAQAVKNLAGLLQKMGDLANAKKHFQRAIEIDTALHGAHHPDVAQDYNNLGMVLQGLGFVREATASYKRALKIDEAVYGSRHPKVAINLNNLANILRQEGDLEGAEAYYNKAAKIFKAALGANHEYTQTAFRNLRKVHDQRKQDKSGPKVLD